MVSPLSALVALSIYGYSLGVVAPDLNPFDVTSASVRQEIKAIDLCTGTTTDLCSSSGRLLSFPTESANPTYSWKVTGMLMSDVAAPAYDVRVVITHPNAPVPFAVPFGI